MEGPEAAHAARDKCAEKPQLHQTCSRSTATSHEKPQWRRQRVDWDSRYTVLLGYPIPAQWMHGYLSFRKEGGI